MKNVTIPQLKRKYNISDTVAKSRLDTVRDKFNLMYTQPVTWRQYLEVFKD